MSKVDFSKYYGKSFFTDFLFRWVDFKKIRLLNNKCASKGFKVLDYGCGTGRISSQIKNANVIGVDNNSELIKIAKKNGIDAIKGDFEKLPFKANTFDVVVSVDSIEHVDSRERAFKEISRVLKPGGELIVFTPGYDSIFWVLGEKFANFLTGMTSGHISPFTKESLFYFAKKYFKQCSKVRRINFGLGIYIIAKNKK